jgi:signal transduction histidine kinase/CheY-like chemotaxis protein
MTSSVTPTAEPPPDVVARAEPLPALELDERVRREQVRILYQQLPYSITGTGIAAVFLAALMWDVASQNAVIGWVLCMAANQIWRLALYFRFRGRQVPAHDVDRWAQYWAAGALISGCLWGAASFLFFVPHSPPHQAFLIVLLFGVVAAAVMLIGIHMPSFYGFVVPALVPIVLRNVIEGGAAHFVLAFVASVTTLAILSFGRNYNRTLMESLRNRFENEALADRLVHQNLELERAKQAADAARSQAETANRSKTQFFAAASHDLRQPLHALGLFAAALSEKAHDPEVQQVVHSINASVDALEGLFNELLDISKIDAGVVKATPGHVALAPLLERVRMDFEPEAFERGLALRVVPTRRFAYTDPVLLERILRNLIANALRYTWQGGVVVGVRRRGRGASIEVWDTGVGIAPAERERVFDEFYQIGNPERNSRKGLGLGLSIVRRLANLMDASVSMSSVRGRGSVFRVLVPLGRRPDLAPAGSRASRPDPGDLSDRVIVVVEDEPAVLQGMEVLLKSWGASVVACSAVPEVVERAAALEGAPDLIIADYRLREGGVGTQAIGALRARFGAEIPAIIVSGSTTPTHLEEASALNAHLLLKPVMPAKLRSLISFKLKGA